MNDTNYDALQQEYDRVRDATGFVRLDRTTIKMTGEDRQKFLHNLCTNDIVKLTAGSGCEAFLCNVQGKILGHVLVACYPDCLVLDADTGYDEAIMAQLDKYLITEDVQLEDLTASTATFALVGPNASSFVGEHLPSAGLESYLQHANIEFAGKPIELIHDGAPLQLANFLLRVSKEEEEAVIAELTKLGAMEFLPELAESLRIASGYPRYGIDVTEKNLPQEVGRDAAAISFNKGCYLGQETVARIDAMGHVNWHLSRIKIEGESVPAAESEVTVGEKVVGRITSATRLDGITWALGYLRREVVESGDSFEVGDVKASIA